MSDDSSFEEDETEYKIWKNNVFVLYDFIHSCVIDWPSLTCEWTCNGSTENLIFGTHKSAICDDKNEIIIAKMNKEVIQQSNVPNLSVDIRVKHHGTVNRVRYSPSSSLIASQSSDTNVYVYDMHQINQTPIKCKGQLSEGYGLSWNSTSNILASASYDNSVFVWNLEKKPSDEYLSPYICLTSHTKEVEDVDWNRKNTNILASVADDRKLLIWDTRSQKLCKPSIEIDEAHESEVNSVSFNFEIEHYLITGGNDSMINLWDLRSYSKPVHHCESQNSKVLVVRWSPMSSSVFASSSDNRVNLWDLTRIGETQSSEDVKSGVPELIFSHAGHKNTVEDFSFSLIQPWTLCSVSQENSLQVWKPHADCIDNDDDFELDCC